jgi:hypothetical protein
MITFFYYIYYICSGTRDTYYTRQATQLDCLPSLPTRAAKAEEKPLAPKCQAHRMNQGKDFFHLYSLSPHSPQFQQLGEATPL